MGTKGNGAVFGFGKGWGIIGFSFFSFWFYAGMVNDSANNLVIPAVAERLGTQLGTLLSFVSVAAIIGACFMVLMGYINKQIGPRKTAFICLMMTAIGYLMLGNATSFGMYIVAECLLQCGGPSAAFIASGTLTAKWFPKKGGMVMGYTTMGLNFSSIIFLPIAAVLIMRFGVSYGVIIPAIACIILALIAIIFVRDNPREKGINPDNVSDEVYKNEYYDMEETPKEDDWKVSKILKTNVFWRVAVGCCLFQFVNFIVVSQVINRGLELGLSAMTATTLFSMCGIIGLAGSWLTGLLDVKIGTKKAMFIMAAWYIISLLFNITNITALAYVFFVMYGFALGGGNNFMTSLPLNVFGRHLFAKINMILCPISEAIACLGVLATGISLNMTGNLRASYIIAVVVIVIDVILISTIKLHKYDPDYMTKEEADKFMADLRS